MVTHLESLFPGLRGTVYQITSPPDFAHRACICPPRPYNRLGQPLPPKDPPPCSGLTSSASTRSPTPCPGPPSGPPCSPPCRCSSCSGCSCRAAGSPPRPAPP